MDDHRQLQRAGGVQLLDEHLALDGARREVVVVVEPDFADRHRRDRGRARAHEGVRVPGPVLADLRLMRMHAGRKPHGAPRLRHFAGPPRLAVVFGRQDAQRALEPGLRARATTFASSGSKTSSARWQWESIMTTTTTSDER